MQNRVSNPLATNLSADDPIMLELIKTQPTQTLSNSLGSTLTASYINATLTAATLNPTERRTANEHLDRIRQEQPFQLDSYSVTLQYIDTAFMVHDAVSLLLLATGTGGVVYFGLRFAFKATAKHYAKRQLREGLLGRREAIKSSIELTKSQLKGIRSLEKQIQKHQQKLDAFKANPTVRPGMENLPKDIIKRQQEARIKHLEAEINTFKNNINKIKNGDL